jgi:hypothetical protein
MARRDHRIVHDDVAVTIAPDRRAVAKLIPLISPDLDERRHARQDNA